MTDRIPCATCKGEGWVCEDHTNVPWGEGDSCCGGAGAPCKCNRLHRDNWTPEMKARAELNKVDPNSRGRTK